MKITFMLLLVAANALAQIPITEARKTKSGKTVTVNGHITATFGDLSFIQDLSGAIAVYGMHLTQEDSISVTGNLSKFNSMLEIVIDSVKSFGQRPSLRPKIVGRIIDHEAELVRIENATMQPVGLIFYPQRAGLLIKDNDTIQYWIDENTDVPGYIIPGTTSITGIVGRYGSRFQLMPRSHNDIEKANVQSPIPIANNHFRVVNWNVEFFGAPRYGPSNDSLQVANVATVLNSIQPDIAALQEVSSDNAFRSLLLKMPGYEGRCSNRYSYSFDTSGDFPPQKLCFVYNTKTVQVVREKILFTKTFDEHPSELFSSGRLPYLLEVAAMDHRLFFINIHGKSGADESDWSRRLADAKLLKDSLDYFYHNKEFVLLGDFNDDVDESIVTGKESPYSDLLKDYNCISKPLSDGGWHSTISYDDMIDHQMISSSLTGYHVYTTIVNVFPLVSLYGKTTSDHLPVVTEFDMTKLVTGITDSDRPNVYPNPTDDKIWFPENSNVTVLNSIGEVIIKKQGAHPPISLGECAPGLYLVVLDGQLSRIVRN